MQKFYVFQFYVGKKIAAGNGGGAGALPPPPLPPISLRPLFITSMYHLMRNSDMGFDLSCGMKVEINRKSSKGKFTPFSVSFLEVERPSKSEH